VSNTKGTFMRKAAAVLAGSMVFMAMLAGTAFAGYTSSPPPNDVVQGAGGGTAFTGGDASTAAIVAVALVAVGLVALFVARRRTASTS
jgi:LPXTG-motif cell wall-anchored protein